VSRTSPPATESPAGLPRRVRGAVRTLNPGYLALVMATGIMSVAMSEHGLPGLSLALLWLAAACYVVLVVLYAWRLVSYRADVAGDLRNPARAFGFFTIVAGTDVLGTRLAADGRDLAAFALLAAAGAAWLALVYLIPWLATLNGHGQVIAEVNGTWFIWAVATQSVAVLAATLEPTVQTGRAALAFLAVFCWSVGIFLYGAAAVFVAARILFYGLSPRDLTPPYWVAMGATAITVLAGARILAMASAPAVDATRPLIAGFSVLFWAFGTWLFPPLIAAGVWRHIVHRVPLGYEAPLWSIIFPLGMYSVASYSLKSEDHLPIAGVIGEVEGWFALAAWVVTFAAMLYHLYATLLREPPAAAVSAMVESGGGP
jgi:tellurite resistance protein TehA-like permease